MQRNLHFKETNCGYFLENQSQILNIKTSHLLRSERSIKPFFVRKIPLWKRAFDILVSSIGLILFAPLFLIIAIIIKGVSPGPVFYKQERIGYGGKSFTLIKFRTMNEKVNTTIHKNYYAKLINCDSNDQRSNRIMIKLDENDPNIIPFGRVLRSSCLDELPQLINVLRGEMSIVGPRPPIEYEVEEYLRWHKGRLDAMPGMTGLWQVSGKNHMSFKEMVRLDIFYSRSMSLYLDIKVLLMTPYAILSELFYQNNYNKR